MVTPAFIKPGTIVSQHNTAPCWQFFRNADGSYFTCNMNQLGIVLSKVNGSGSGVIMLHIMVGRTIATTMVDHRDLDLIGSAVVGF